MTQPSVSPSPAAARLADQLERSFRGGSWHGPSVLEALSGVDAATAAARPIADAHTIAEITGHVAAWLDVAARRLGGERAGDLSPEANFPPAAAGSDEAWRGTLEALDEAHRRLHTATAALSDEELEAPVAGSDPTVRGLLLGVLQHNVYHAGQIVILAKAAAGGARA